MGLFKDHLKETPKYLVKSSNLIDIEDSSSSEEETKSQIKVEESKYSDGAENIEDSDNSEYSDYGEEDGQRDCRESMKNSENINSFY